MLLATIEHSGTMVTLAQQIGREPWRITKADSMPPGRVICTHLWDHEMPLILELAKRMPLATTHRPVELIRASWIRRGKDLAELDRQLANYQIVLGLNPTIYEVDR